jgi:hypothetical protein
VVGDDIIGEIITGITINGSVINGGQINGGVITGAVIQTAETGERVVLDADGLKTYDADGNLVIEATTATNGALKAGVGTVTLDRDGLSIEGNSSTGFSFTIDTKRAAKWEMSGSDVAYVAGGRFNNSNMLLLRAPNNSTTAPGVVWFEALSSGGGYDPIGAFISGGDGSGAPSILIENRDGLTTVTGPRAIATAGGYIEMVESSEPAAPATNKARLFVRDNGSGKTQVCVRFPTGAIQVIATEP